MLDEIINQIINGNRVDALHILNDSHYTFTDLIDTLIQYGMVSEIKRMYHCGQGIGYFKEGL